MWKFTGKMPDPPANTSIEHRVLTVTVRTPQCGHTVWGNVFKKLFRVGKVFSFLLPVDQPLGIENKLYVPEKVFLAKPKHETEPLQGYLVEVP